MTELDVPRIVPFADVDDFESVAVDLRTLLWDKTNADIEPDFPLAFNFYRGDIQQAKDRMETFQRICEPGIREQFVIFVGPTAVGMAVVTQSRPPAEHVNSSWPNVSLFICRPHRAQGIGKLTIERQLQAVNEDFGGHAWTEVRVANTASHKLVTRAGFVDTKASLDPKKRLYTYGS